MANSYLSRTPSGAGSRVKWTYSVWLKRSKLGHQPIWAATTDSNNYDEFYFNSSDKIQFSTVTSGTQKAIRTSRIFRDTSAWYHIVLVYDTGNSTHLLLINNAGDFGIGTTNPGAISGGCTTMTFGSTAAALSGGVLFQANGTNVNGTYWESDNMRYQNIGDYSHTFYKNNSTVLFTIATTGTVTATGDVVAYSDERLKSDIKTLDGSKVLKMRGVSFKKEGKKGSGVIAQELEKIAPELVNNDSEYKGVAYGNLSGYLIEAIKEQQKQIDRLEEQIKKMSSKN